MTCDKALELMSAALDGELTKQEAAALQAHLDGCPDCRAADAQLRGMDAFLKEAEYEPPAALHTNVMRAVRQEKAASRRRFWAPAGLIAAAAALVLTAGSRGLIDLPGFSDRAQASNNAHSAIGSVLPEQTLAQQAQAIAAERGAPVLTLADTPEALADVPYETLKNGAKLYETDGKTLKTLQSSEENAALFLPSAMDAVDDAARAYVLLAG